jgi:hypothetical protein
MIAAVESVSIRTTVLDAAVATDQSVVAITAPVWLRPVASAAVWSIGVRSVGS